MAAAQWSHSISGACSSSTVGRFLYGFLTTDRIIPSYEAHVEGPAILRPRRLALPSGPTGRVFVGRLDDLGSL